VTWLKAILALLQLAGALTRYLERQGAMDDGARRAILDALQKETADVEKALAARAAARSELERNPGGLQVDDGFKRPD
jgi:hypothetical protein